MTIDHDLPPRPSPNAIPVEFQNTPEVNAIMRMGNEYRIITSVDHRLRTVGHENLWRFIFRLTLMAVLLNLARTADRVRAFILGR